MLYACIAYTIVALLVNYYIPNALKIDDAIILYNGVFIGAYLIILLIIVLLTAHAFSEKTKMDLKIAQYNSLIEYTNNIEQMNSRLSSFKHDYINIMSSMTAYLEEQDYDGLTRYFEQSILPMNQRLLNKDSKIKQLRNLKISELKGLLSSKLNYASGLGLNVSIEIYEEIEHINMDLIDLSRIFGIFMDNAIEAACETEVQTLTITMIKKERSVVSIIRNTEILSQCAI